jgi:small subunit ribosomal protein S2
MVTDKQYADVAGVTTQTDIQASAEDAVEAVPDDTAAEVVDLEAALGGGIRKAPAIVAALEEAEAAESSSY